MIDYVWNNLVAFSNSHTNFFWAIFGALIGYFLPKLFDSIQSLFSKEIHSLKLKGLNKEISELEDYLAVEILNTGNQPYSSNAIDIKVEDQFFYIAPPSKLIPKLKEKFQTEDLEFSEFFELHPDTGFDGEKNFEKMALNSGIHDLVELIEVARTEVAHEFLGSENGQYFNASKYGVWDIDFTKKFGKREDRHLSLSLYHTDYFTFKVTQNIFHKISQRENMTSEITPNKLKKYNLFLSSFGLNALIILNDKSMGDICVFAERSTLASDTKKSNTYHITMNEGLNQDDKNHLDNKVRLSNCLERGLWEELGLNNDYYAQDMTSDFHDLFLVKSSFQLGISASVNIKDMSFEDLYSRAETAKDKNLEIKRLKPINFEKHELEKFLSKNDFIPYSRFIISRICSHKGVLLNPRKTIRVKNIL